MKKNARKKLLKSDSRRRAVDWAMAQKDYSQRKACELVDIAPRVHRYRSKRDDDAGAHSGVSTHL